MVRNCAPENLEIPGFDASHRPGMTMVAKTARRTGKSRLQLRHCEIGWPCLDIGTLAAMFAQPSGSFVRRLRNIITKLLIVVVAGRTAGDG
jgi:hypothetical protein